MRTIAQGDQRDERYFGLIDGLVQSVFGFSFREWRALGQWDDRYECYSVIEGGRLLANVSVSQMELLIGGQRLAAIQIGAVATAPEYRGQGLARQLMEYVLDRYDGTPAFLLANGGVLDFYPKFGFRRVHEVQPYVRFERSRARPASGPPGGSECFKVRPDSPVLAQMLASRSRFSKVADVVNVQSVNWFHLITEFRDCIYYVPGHDAIVVAEQEGSTLLVYDVLGSPDVVFLDLLGCLPFPGAEMVEFAFTPDWLCEGFGTAEYRREDSWGYLFARKLDFEVGPKFPYMATT